MSLDVRLLHPQYKCAVSHTHGASALVHHLKLNSPCILDKTVYLHVQERSIVVFWRQYGLPPGSAVISRL